MPSSRQKIIDELYERFSQEINTDKAISLLAITGIFGTGKTYIADNIISKLMENSIYDVAIRLDKFDKLNYFPDLALQIIKSIFENLQINLDQFKPEILNLKNKFDENLWYLKTKHESFYEKTTPCFKIKNNYDQIYRSTQKEFCLLNEYKNSELNKIFSGKFDKIIFNDQLNYIIETFIYDLLSLILNESNIELLKAGVLKPLKILILLEDYYDISEALYYFLTNSFLTYLNDFKFSQLKYFKPELIHQNQSISDIIDIRFILTIRQNINENIENKFKKILENKYFAIELSHFNENEFIEIIQKSEIDDYQVENQIFKTSRAHPLITDSLIKFYKTNQFLPETNIIYSSIAEYYLRNFNSEKTQIILKATYFEKLSSSILRIFPDLKNYYDFSFNFLTSQNDSFFYNQSSNQIETNEFIFLLFQEYRQLNHKNEIDTINKYQQLNKVLSQIFIYINNLLLDKSNLYHSIELIRHFAYFKSFIANQALERIFQIEANTSKNYIDKFPDLFIENNHSFSLLSHYFMALNEYNHIIDGEEFNEKIKIIELFWDEYSNELIIRNGNFEKEISKIAIEIKEMEDEKEELIKRVSETKELIVKNSIFEKEINSSLSIYNKTYKDGLGKITSSIGSIFVVIALVLEILSIQTFSILSIDFKLILLILGFASIFSSYSYLIKKWKYRKNYVEIQSMKKRLSNLENSKILNLDKLNVEQADLNAILSKILDLKKHIERLNKQVLENQSKLTEKFV